MKNFPTVDYRAHPAFEKLFIDYVYDDHIVDEIINEIDTTYQRYIETIYENDPHESFKSLNHSIYRLELYVKDKIQSILAYELFSQACEYVKKELLQHAIRRKISKNFKETSANKEILSSLSTNGMHIVSIGKNIKEKLYEGSRPYYKRLKDKAIQNPHQRSYEAVDPKDLLGITISKMVKEYGILDVVSSYMQMDMEIMGTGIEYSCEQHDWYKESYPDLLDYKSQLEYLHLDDGEDYPKTLCYLSPVLNEKQGATQYIKKSNIWKRSKFVTLFHKGLDSVIFKRYCNLMDYYYRPGFKHLELRKILAFLPSRLIGTSHFGDDIIDGSSLSKEILENQVIFLSDGSEVIVFDGGNGLHKGATVKEGERLSLQIIYKPKIESRMERIYKRETYKDRIKALYSSVKNLVE